MKMNLKDFWKKGKPDKSGLWVDLDFNKRWLWLDEVRLYCCNRGKPQIDKEPNLTYEIDGSIITDYPSFFCAIGEAINGPGGYFGGSLDALDDCLCGDFGAKTPFLLRWHNHRISKKYLTNMAWKKEIERRRDEGNLDASISDESLFEVIVNILEKRHVKIEYL